MRAKAKIKRNLKVCVVDENTIYNPIYSVYKTLHIKKYGRSQTCVSRCTTYASFGSPLLKLVFVLVLTELLTSKTSPGIAMGERARRSAPIHHW